MDAQLQAGQPVNKAPVALTPKDLRACWRAWMMYNLSSMSFERLESFGFCLGMMPALKKLYPGKAERTEAMKRHTTVTVTNGGTWLDGWNTQTNSGEPFVDANGNNVYDAGEVYDDRNDNGAYDAGVAVTLKSAQPFTGSSLRGCAVSSGGTVVSGAFLNQIVFRGDGTVANAAIGAEDGIRLSDVTNRLTTDIRDIRIAPTGRITVDVIRAGDPKRAALTPCPGP